MRWIRVFPVVIIAPMLLIQPASAATAAGPGPGSSPRHYTEHPGQRNLPIPPDGTAGAALLRLTAHPECTLIVPASPLTAQGLATPYQLGSASQQCSENNENLAAFVQATILDPATGAIQVYNPVVRDAGQPLAGPAPVAPKLPPGAVVTVWTGYNGNVLKLAGPGAGSFVNFAQQSWANSPQFFSALATAVKAGKVHIPPLGTAKDGKPCPSLRGFSVVDQDQSDNTTTAYPAYGVSNGSDDALLQHIDQALGCAPWSAASGTSGAMEEAQAAAFQGAPAALVPALDDFVTLNGQANLDLQNLYRLQLAQPAETASGAMTDTKAYCSNLATVGEPRLKMDAAMEAGFPAPQFAPVGLNLALVLAARFQATWTLLTCQALTGQPSPVTVTVNQAGVATAAAYK